MKRKKKNRDIDKKYLVIGIALGVFIILGSLSFVFVQGQTPPAGGGGITALFDQYGGEEAAYTKSDFWQNPNLKSSEVDWNKAIEANDGKLTPDMINKLSQGTLDKQVPDSTQQATILKQFSTQNNIPQIAGEPSQITLGQNDVTLGQNTWTVGELKATNTQQILVNPDGSTNYIGGSNGQFPLNDRAYTISGHSNAKVGEQVMNFENINVGKNGALGYNIDTEGNIKFISSAKELRVNSDGGFTTEVYDNPNDVIKGGVLDRFPEFKESPIGRVLTDSTGEYVKMLGRVKMQDFQQKLQLTQTFGEMLKGLVPPGGGAGAGGAPPAGGSGTGAGTNQAVVRKGTEAGINDYHVTNNGNGTVPGGQEVEVQTGNLNDLFVDKNNLQIILPNGDKKEFNSVEEFDAYLESIGKEGNSDTTLFQDNTLDKITFTNPEADNIPPSTNIFNGQNAADPLNAYNLLSLFG